MDIQLPGESTDAVNEGLAMGLVMTWRKRKADWALGGGTVQEGAHANIHLARARSECGGTERSMGRSEVDPPG